MKTFSTVIRMIHKRNILPSKEQVVLHYFIVTLCVYFVCILLNINNTAIDNTSLMLNKLLHNTEYLQCLL